MNNEHYDQVRKAIMTCQGMLDRLGGNVPEAARHCESVWSVLFKDIVGPLDLSDADLNGALFIGSGCKALSGANLRGAKLDGTRWEMAEIADADFTGASLRGAIMKMVRWPRCRFHAADLTGSEMRLALGPEIDFSDADLSNVVFQPFPSAGGGDFTFTRARMEGVVIEPSVGRDGGSSLLGAGIQSFMDCLSEAQKAQVHVASPEEIRARIPAAPPPSPGKCFIATAAFGDESAQEVMALRHFRETVLRPTRLGRLAIATYEALSPPLADWIRGSEVRRRVVRSYFVGPTARWAARLKAGFSSDSFLDLPY